MSVKSQLLISIIFLSLQYTPAVSAAVFKCVSATGKIIYSSKKCVGNSEAFVLKKEKYVNRPSVDIYITSWCPYCKKAMAYLRSNGIAFNAYDIEKNARAKARKQKLDPAYSGIPLTVINGKVLKGFSASRFGNALGL